MNLLLGAIPDPLPGAAPWPSSLTLQKCLPVCPHSCWSAGLIFAKRSRTLIAANANVGVAKANFFPTISLTGLLGGVSPQLSELTGDWQSVEPRWQSGRSSFYRRSLEERISSISGATRPGEDFL